MKYSGVPKNINDLTNQLISKGLIVSNKPDAEHHIFSTGFFRFKRYSSIFHIIDGKGDYTFIKDTHFDFIEGVYHFDSSLRIALFEAIAEIEVAFKSILNFTMTLKHGAHWYLDPAVFKDKFTKDLDFNYESSYDKFIVGLTKECNETRESYIKKYKDYYTDPALPPSWLIMEILPFGTCCKLFQNISEGSTKASICTHFGVDKRIFETWLFTLSYVRNQCAHHHKIVNRIFMFPPILPNRKDHMFLKEGRIVDTDSLYAVLCIVRYTLLNLKSKSFFKENVIDLIDNNPQIQLDRLGFTEHWRKEAIWQ